MNIKILGEYGFEWAMLGLSLNKKQNHDDMPKVADKLYNKEGGHNKFLESITVYLDLNLPRFMWSEFDTYRVGITKQSESTMHTLKKERVTNKNFEYDVPEYFLSYINGLIEYDKSIQEIKNILPDGFLQRRIICTNYKTLRNIVKQRENHRLPQWKEFCNYLKENLEHKQYMI